MLLPLTFSVWRFITRFKKEIEKNGKEAKKPKPTPTWFSGLPGLPAPPSVTRRPAAPATIHAPRALHGKLHGQLVQPGGGEGHPCLAPVEQALVQAGAAGGRGGVDLAAPAGALPLARRVPGVQPPLLDHQLGVQRQLAVAALAHLEVAAGVAAPLAQHRPLLVLQDRYFVILFFI